jgi:hypothetical protein
VGWRLSNGGFRTDFRLNPRHNSGEGDSALATAAPTRRRGVKESALPPWPWELFSLHFESLMLGIYS